VPGMFQRSEGASPSANLMEVKARETQGRHREVRSERSVYHRCEPTNRNWIRGVEVGRVRMRARSPYPSKPKDVNPAVVRRKCRSLPRETYRVSQPDSGGKGLRAQ
jgi:hypothetical protein